MALRLRRGTNAERLLIVPAAGELIYTTDTKKVYIGDGATEGGLPIDTGALSINELTDVNTTLGDSTQPANGEALVWDSNNQEWRPGVVSGGGGASALIDLSDVSVSALNVDQILSWDGANFVNITPEFDLEDEAFPTLGGPLNANSQNITGINILSATTLQGDGSALTGIQVSSDATPTLGGDLDANNNSITGADGITANTFTGDGSALTNLPIDISQDLTPVLAGELNANNNNITGVNSLSAQSISGNGAGLFALDISTDTTPELGGNLALNGNNITGTGTIQITGNMQCDVFVSNIASSRFYGDLTGSVFADDSAVFYDSINHTASADTLTASTSLTTPRILTEATQVEIGAPDDPKDLYVYTNTTSDAMYVYKAGSTYAGYGIRNSAGTIGAPQAQADGDVVGAYAFKSWDGTQYTNTGILASVIDGTVSAGVAPGKLQLASYDASGNPNIMEYDATGTLTPGNITVSGKLNVTAAAPGNATDTGTVGEIRVDTDYIYVCTASNTWKRVAIATWP